MSFVVNELSDFELAYQLFTPDPVTVSLQAEAGFRFSGGVLFAWKLSTDVVYYGEKKREKYWLLGHQQ